MPITINGSGTITGLNVGGLPDGIVDTDTLATTARGKILQVKQTTVTDVKTIASTSIVDVPGMSVTLTPSSGTKCLVTYNLQASCEDGAYNGSIILVRDSTNIHIGDADGAYQRCTSWVVAGSGYGDYTTFPLNASYLDTHGANGSTAVTYKLQGRSYGTNAAGTMYFNRSHQDALDTAGGGRGAMSLTVMEVAA